MARSPTATLVMLCGCVVLSMTSWFSAAAVLPQLRVLWQLSDSAAAWLTIAVQLGFVAGALLSAFTNLADLVPPRRLMAGCAAAAALVNLGLLAAPGAASAIALRLLTGVVMAGIYPPALKLVATWFRAGRGLALGSVIGGLTLGSALPHLANAAGGLPWQGVIVSASLATLAGGAGVLLLVRDGPYPFPAARFDPAALGAGFANRAVLLATAGYLGHMWELYAMWAWMLSFLRARLVADGAWAASLLTFAVVAAGAPGCVAAGWAADRGRAHGDDDRRHAGLGCLRRGDRLCLDGAAAGAGGARTGLGHRRHRGFRAVLGLRHRGRRSAPCRHRADGAARARFRPHRNRDLAAAAAGRLARPAGVGCFCFSRLGRRSAASPWPCCVACRKRG